MEERHLRPTTSTVLGVVGEHECCNVLEPDSGVNPAQAYLSPTHAGPLPSATSSAGVPGW
jgi:hypothetical protein